MNSIRVLLSKKARMAVTPIRCEECLQAWRKKSIWISLLDSHLPQFQEKFVGGKLYGLKESPRAGHGLSGFPSYAELWLSTESE